MELKKLLVHRIPINVHTEDLHEIIPGEFTLEVKVYTNWSFLFLILIKNSLIFLEMGIFN